VIALVLGGAPSVWTDLAAAKAMLAGQRHLIVAANLAGIHHQGPLDAWATLHPEHLDEWTEARGQGGYRVFSPAKVCDCVDVEVAPERWNGSSGLYALQIALEQMNASAAILCGVPMEQAAGHFLTGGPWAPVTSYRQAFAAALPIHGGRVRSMGGWTADLFGTPSPAWIAAASTMKPGQRGRPARTRPMHKVTNTSKTTQRFNAIRPEGGFDLVRLAPGESKDVEIDTMQPKFTGGALKVDEIKPTKAAGKPEA
jgi:hypothetical protein